MRHSFRPAERGRLLLATTVCFVLVAWAAAPAPSRADLLAGDFAVSNVARFSDAGISIAGGVAPGSAGLNGAAGVAVGPHDGNIYVSSLNSLSILHFDGETGAPIDDGLFASFASAPGPLRFGPDGYLYVSDFGGSTVRVFDTMGVEQAPAVTGFSLAPPAGMAFAPNGDLYVGDFGTGRVDRVHGGMQEPFITSGSSTLQASSSLLFLPDGDLLIVDQNTSKVLRFDSEGNQEADFATIVHTNPGNNFPSDIAYDADGNLVLAVLGDPLNGIPSRLLRYDLDGMPVGTGTVVEPALGTAVMSSIAWIKSVGAVTGDYDGLGAVGLEDYLEWKADYGKRVANGGGADGNGDGRVTAADYTIWRNALEISAESAGLARVPEPSAVLLLMAAVAPLVLSQRRRRAAPRR
jgi:hypothetical protein